MPLSVEGCFESNLAELGLGESGDDSLCTRKPEFAVADGLFVATK